MILQFRSRSIYLGNEKRTILVSRIALTLDYEVICLS
jgi:hypothetical protein